MERNASTTSFSKSTSLRTKCHAASLSVSICEQVLQLVYDINYGYLPCMFDYYEGRRVNNNFKNDQFDPSTHCLLCGRQSQR